MGPAINGPGRAASEGARARLDPAGAEAPANLGRIDPVAVVVDRERDLVAAALEAELEPPGAGVAERVGQPLLGDPEQGEADGRREPVGDVTMDEAALEARASLELADQHREGLDQRAVLQRLRAQGDEHLAETPLDPLDLVSEAGEGVEGRGLAVEPDAEVDQVAGPLADRAAAAGPPAGAGAMAEGAIDGLDDLVSGDLGLGAQATAGGPAERVAPDHADTGGASGDRRHRVATAGADEDVGVAAEDEVERDPVGPRRRQHGADLGLDPGAPCYSTL